MSDFFLHLQVVFLTLFSFAVISKADFFPTSHPHILDLWNISGPIQVPTDYFSKQSDFDF